VKTKPGPKKWDLIAYKLGDKISYGTVLRCLGRGSIRTDTDGAIESRDIVAIEPGKGKAVIYASKEYKEYESYRIWLRDNYGLRIKEV
jgi:hypothetical protein